jgi:hypothetical protein
MGDLIIGFIAVVVSSLYLNDLISGALYRVTGPEKRVIKKGRQGNAGFRDDLCS